MTCAVAQLVANGKCKTHGVVELPEAALKCIQQLNDSHWHILAIPGDTIQAEQHLKSSEYKRLRALAAEGGVGKAPLHRRNVDVKCRVSFSRTFYERSRALLHVSDPRNIGVVALPP